jgi:DNA-binding PadR family transcriptional regulator
MTSQTLAILAAMLSDAEKPWYGLELARSAGLTTGTVYPALARLEHAGWLASRWEAIDPHVAGRPRRRLYELTPDGRAHGQDAIDEHLRRLQVSTHGTMRPRPALGGAM